LEFVRTAFEKDYRIVLYDNIGASHSDLSFYEPEKYQNLNGYVQDLLEICDELHLQNSIFIGHSVSGMVGLLASLERPELFSKLVLIGVSPRYLNDEGYMGGFNQTDLDEVYRNIKFNYEEWAKGFSVMAMRNEDRPMFAESFFFGLLTLRPDIAYALISAIFQYDYRWALPAVEHPVLIIQAENDIAVPLGATEYLHQNVKNSTLNYIKAEGHFPHITQSAEVSEAIASFLE